MDEHESDVPANALEDIAYLSRSINRVRILDVLTDRPASRQELVESIGTSRATIDRVVNEFENRGWAERTVDGTYIATAWGIHLQEQFNPFLESVAALHRLGGAVEWLPVEELTIGLHHFADAEVVGQEQDDPVETIDMMVEMVEAATDFRAFTHLVPPVPLAEATLDGVESGRLTAEGVLTADSIAFLSDHPDRRECWAAIIDAGGPLYRYDGDIPCNVWVIDETVLIKKSGPEPFADAYGVPIVSQNREVRAWANQLIDTYRDRADRLSPAYFTEFAPSTE